MTWASRQLERKCSSDAQGRRHWGAEQWAVLKRRLASLVAAPTLEAMAGIPGNCHPLTEDRPGQFAMDLRGPYRLIFRPDHEPVPLKDDGGIDPSQVTRISILEVVDYHGR